MARVRISTTVDEQLLATARRTRSGLPDAALIDEALGILGPLLAREVEPDVIEVALHGVALTGLAGGIPIALPFATHPVASVRLDATHALYWCAGEPASRQAIDALIRLSNDQDDDVRDWSTFGLGTHIVADDPVIRDALAERLVDDHLEVREEAAVGLARRRDERAFEPVRALLEAFAAHQPVFSNDDLALAQLLADQAAVVLESRALIDEAARVQALEDSAKLKEDFVSAAAHDLKTPLTTLLGQAQILEVRFARDPALAAHQPAIGRIAREARRLSALVEDLLDASRIEEGKLDVRRELVDVGAVVRQVVERHRPDRERIVVDALERLPGSFDPRRIEQLVDNLVENGLKYSDLDSPVEVHAWRDMTAIRISVRDHGIGIPATDLPFVFERFHRAGNVDARRYAGIGLGLYICRGIAQEHGGRIWVESTVGEGSTFHVALPDAGEGKLN